MSQRKAKASLTYMLRNVFAIPALLFVIVLTGLIVALLYDGWMDLLAALAVSSSLCAVLWARFR
jgi:fumarate reductase subunit C